MVSCNSSRTLVNTESKLGDDGDLACLYMHDPWEPYFSALKRILRYLDADWAGCPTTQRSTSGYYVFLGNNLLSWSSKRQPTLSRSSADAEYRGVANTIAETCWLRNLLRELHTPLSSATLVYCDNVSAVCLSSNPIQYQRTKHIEIDIYFVRDFVAASEVRVLHVPSRYQYADIFTKGLPSALFEEFRTSLSVQCHFALTAGEVILKYVTLDVTDLLDTSDMRNVILAKVRDVHLILNINNVLKKEGFYSFQCKYIGGMWLWIKFNSLETCQKLQSNKEMSWYFILMKHVTQTFKADERVIWIEIGGLPLNAWTTKAYKKIAGSWGEPLFVDEDPHDNVAMGSNYKADNSDNHDHDDNDCGFHDVEEGEIPKTNVSQEEEVVMNTQWSVDAKQNEKDPLVDSPIKLEE
ncbi:ribonuclease H-like domain-containing protein [Tanacetum coccineum]